MDFNDLFILECFQTREDMEYIELYVIPSMEDFTMSSRFQFLKREEYLVEDPNDTSKLILSMKGKTLLEELTKTSITSTKEVVIDLGKSSEECFEEWWKTYPTTTAWRTDDGNISFTGSRHLKGLKAKAKEKYLKLLNQGLKHEELLGSLKYEIKMKKLDSIKKNANQMEYFKGMDSYFNSERYLQHIEDYRNNPDFVKGEEGKVKKRRNVTDI